MSVICLDFETYYSQTYSLSRMSEIDYILSPEFETILCAVKVDDGPVEVHVGHDAVARRLAAIDWSQHALLAHNARFDGAIAAWHYGVCPALYLDTLGMARATTHVHAGRSSLAAVAGYLGLPPKGDEVQHMLGINLAALRALGPHRINDYIHYCKRDAELCYNIYKILSPLFCDNEIRFMDLLLRMFIEPQVKLNPNKLAEYAGEVRAEKEAIMARVAHIDPDVFSSANKFKELLEQHGVEVPVKISPATGAEIPALAKNDRAFRELCDDQAQPLEVQAILAARISAKSTLEETRTATLLNLSLREWPEGRGPGWAPVPLKYYGAHTGRVSGDGGFNWTNFKRGSTIRAAVEAPPGWRIVHRDSSQIEARMVAWLARCETLLDAFAKGRDIYSEFASMVYERPVTKADAGLRFVGKTSILGLGYGMGATRFQHTLRIGNGGMSASINLEMAERVVKLYRDAYPEIPTFWKTMDMIFKAQAKNSYYYGALLDRHAEHMRGFAIGQNAIWLPNGMCIAYPLLSVDNEGNITYGRARGAGSYDRIKLFGGKITENISQALARIVITDAAVRIYQRTGYHMWMHTYDSLDYCVPAEDAAWMNDVLDDEFRRRPDWALDLPLASEGGWGVTLMDAEKKRNN